MSYSEAHDEESTKFPYIIDNQTHRLADVLSGLLAEHKGRSLDVATAYFMVGGFEEIGVEVEFPPR